MADKLPVVKSGQELARTLASTSTLLGRGLAAIQQRQIAIADQDKRYRQARDVYDRIAGYTWYEFDDYGYPTLEKFTQFQSCLASFQSLADLDYGKAYFPLSVIYKLGCSELKNEKLAIHYAPLAFDWCYDHQSSDDAEIWSDLGVIYHWGEVVDEDQSLAHSLFLKAAVENNAQAQYFLGNLYCAGKGVGKDYLEACYWYGKSVAQGYLDFSMFLGFLARIEVETGKVISFYDLGEKCESDNFYEQTVFWYRKAAEQGHATAECILGAMYQLGYRGIVEKDYEQALFWYRKAAEHGYSRAECNLGKMYENGYGVEQDYEQAVFWYEKAAGSVLGAGIRDEEAEYNLGRMYANGLGVKQSYVTAAICYYGAAQQYHPQAQYCLGQMHFDGQGVEQDDKAAVYWWRRASQSRHMEAQASLGFMYLEGRGVEQDDELARFWYRKAAEQGHIRAQEQLMKLGFNEEE